MATVPDTAAPPDRPHRPTVPVRVAILSIVGFWLFYFAIVTVRGVAIGFPGQAELLLPRALVMIGGVAITYLIYLVLRALPGASFPAAIAAAALLAVPAAILYSTLNWFAFRAVNERLMAETPTVVIHRRGSVPLPLPPRAPTAGDAAMPPAPPLPPLPSETLIQIGGDPMNVQTHDKMSAAHAIAENAANGYFFLVGWAAVYLALCYAAGAAAAERRVARFRAAAQSAELRALRYQVNPHFLFNTLNSLSSLVMVDRREEAERMILNLSTFFRTSLTADPAEDLPLAEEIRLQRLYLDIEQVRFPDRLRVEIDVPEGLRNACVPALILQPLIENAIKYGVSRSREPVTIRIEGREDSAALVLTVADDAVAITGPEPDGAGTGVGLRNVSDRLAARFGAAAHCRSGARPGGGFLVTLTLPLVRNGC